MCGRIIRVVGSSNDRHQHLCYPTSCIFNDGGLCTFFCGEGRVTLTNVTPCCTTFQTEIYNIVWHGWYVKHRVSWKPFLGRGASTLKFSSPPPLQKLQTHHCPHSPPKKNFQEVLPKPLQPRRLFRSLHWLRIKYQLAL